MRLVARPPSVFKALTLSKLGGGVSEMPGAFSHGLMQAMNRPFPRPLWYACAFLSPLAESFRFGGFMRWLRALVLAVSCASVGAACSSGEPAPAPTSDGPVGEVSQAITAACGFDTIGLPCDPDGPGEIGRAHV